MNKDKHTIKKRMRNKTATDLWRRLSEQNETVRGKNHTKSTQNERNEKNANGTIEFFPQTEDNTSND